LGVLDKIAFWKKKDDMSDITSDPMLNTPDPAQTQHPEHFGAQPFDQAYPQQQQPYREQPMQQFSEQQSTQPYPQQYPEQQSSQPYPQHEDKTLELISVKLDAIKSELDAMNQRIKKIEAIADGEQKKSYW